MNLVQLKQLFEYMLNQIGGVTNDDIDWYLYKRPKEISRNEFFKAVVWAIWVSGMSRKATKSFLARSEGAGFDWSYVTFASFDEARISQFIKLLHGWTINKDRPRSRPVPNRVVEKWNAVHAHATNLTRFTTEEQFRNEFFEGKIQSSSLDKHDIYRLTDKKLPFIGEVNSHFVIRNIGGEAIKRDRWIDAFLIFYKLGQIELENMLNNAGIPLGYFDVVEYAYCEQSVQDVAFFNQHFDDLNSRLFGAV